MSEQWRTGTPLQRLIGAAKEEQELSLREIADKGEGLVSVGSVSNIIRGVNVDLTERTVVGLSRALHIPEAKIRSAIAASTDHGARRYEVPPRLDQLSPEAWQALVSFGDYLLDREQHPSRKPRPPK